MDLESCLGVSNNIGPQSRIAVTIPLKGELEL